MPINDIQFRIWHPDAPPMSFGTVTVTDGPGLLPSPGSDSPSAEVGFGLPEPLTAAPADSPLLRRLNDIVERLKQRGVKAAEIGTAVRAVIHSPLTGLLVAATPNTVDDAALEVLKALFPQAA